MILSNDTQSWFLLEYTLPDHTGFDGFIFPDKFKWVLKRSYMVEF